MRAIIKIEFCYSFPLFLCHPAINKKLKRMAGGDKVKEEKTQR